MLDLQSVYFGQKHKDFNYQDFDLIKKIQRLARKHQKQCENSCNGEGWVNGQFFTCGAIDEQNCQWKSAYIGDDEESIFDKEASKIEEKIKSLLLKGSYFFKVEFQGDPRGATVKLYYDGYFIELQ